MNGFQSNVLRLLRRLLSGESDKAFVFRKSDRRDFSGLTGTKDFYLHIPYCRSRCAHCPYNTRRLDLAELDGFFAALLGEARLLRDAGIVSDGRSLYVGGGTPTSVGPRLYDFLRQFTDIFGQPRSIAVETRPDDVTSEVARGLRDAGVSQISLGIQSFSSGVLTSLGRQGDPVANIRALEIVRDGGFANVNADIMFSPDAESPETFRADLEKAVAAGVDQVTAYPLFKFSHSAFGERRGLGRLVMPRVKGRREFYRLFWGTMRSAGFDPVSVWSFKRREGSANAAVFSSVKRSTFVGLGPGAATSSESYFAFNTFDTLEWERRIREGRPAYSIEMKMNPNLRALYDLYWMLYAVRLSRSFSPDLKRRGLIACLRSVCESLGLVGGDGVLTETGAFWIHLLQNHYILAYIDKVWAISKREPFPDEIRL